MKATKRLGILAAGAMTGPAAPFIAAGAMLTFAAIDAYDGWNNAGTILGKKKADLTVVDKIAGAAAQVVSGLTFGIVSAKAIADFFLKEAPNMKKFEKTMAEKARKTVAEIGPNKRDLKIPRTAEAKQKQETNLASGYTLVSKLKRMIGKEDRAKKIGNTIAPKFKKMNLASKK